LWIGVIDDYDGWAAREMLKTMGAPCGPSDYGNWLDHRVVDSAGELYSLLVVVALYPEFKPFWSIVILRQSFLSGDDSNDSVNGSKSSIRWSQVIPFSPLWGCVHHQLTVVSILRLIANIFVDILSVRSERRAGKAEDDITTQGGEGSLVSPAGQGEPGGWMKFAQGTRGDAAGGMLPLLDVLEEDAKAHHSWRSRLEEAALRFLTFKGKTARVLLSPVFVFFGMTFLVWHPRTCACNYTCQIEGLQ
jgi:hypothetical protein